MKLPNYENAYIDMNKLAGYCLNAEHDRGKDKAIVFKSRLGLTVENSELLRDNILEAIKSYPAEEIKATKYGKRYVVEFEMITLKGKGIVKTAWIVRYEEDFPRLVTCFLK